EKHTRHCSTSLYDVLGLIFFFFSSRRRHTRSYGDWSSDVCSSDLVERLQRVGDRRIWPGDAHYGSLQVVDRLLCQQRGELRPIRSEERRVGKECRSRWWTDQ